MKTVFIILAILAILYVIWFVIKETIADKKKFDKNKNNVPDFVDKTVDGVKDKFEEATKPRAKRPRKKQVKNK